MTVGAFQRTAVRDVAWSKRMVQLWHQYRTVSETQRSLNETAAWDEPAFMTQAYVHEEEAKSRTQFDAC
jgi:hypothetical protein